MLKILRHGALRRVSNPSDGSETLLRTVVFQEEGRTGANLTLASSTNFLNNLLGRNVGLKTTRTHSQPVLDSEIGLFPVGQTIPGHINRKIFSVPQMDQQENVEPQMVNGKPVFFVTYLDDEIKDDVDLTESNETMMRADATFLLRAKTRKTRVVEVEPDQFRASQAQGGYTHTATEILEQGENLTGGL